MTTPDEALVEAHRWREAILNELAIWFIAAPEYENDPRLALRTLIEMERKVALDPAVSEDAQSLCARVEKETLERAAGCLEKEAVEHRMLLDRGIEGFEWRYDEIVENARTIRALPPKYGA